MNGKEWGEKISKRGLCPRDYPGSVERKLTLSWVDGLQICIPLFDVL